jgi:hypothetical protein
LLQDVRYGLRMMLKSPAFTAVAVLSLALGIGANTGVFSLINGLRLRPLPVEEPARLMTLFTTDAKNPGNLPTSHLNDLDYRERGDLFSGVLAYTFAQLSWSQGGAGEQIFALVVSGNYFDRLGVKAAHGRTFLPEEDRTPGTHPVAVLSHGFWQRSFGGDRNIVGRTITLNRPEFTVVGFHRHRPWPRPGGLGADDDARSGAAGLR